MSDSPELHLSRYKPESMLHSSACDMVECTSSIQHRHPIAKTFKHPAYVKHSQGISQENLRELICFPKISTRPSQNTACKPKQKICIFPIHFFTSIFLPGKTMIVVEETKAQSTAYKIEDSNISKGNLANLNNQKTKIFKFPALVFRSIFYPASK